MVQRVAAGQAATYDLGEKLEQVCRQIRTWNGQPEGK
jgi:hypothetical protein